MTPVRFAGCAGFLHPAPGSRAVILCGSLGFESLCSHSGLMRLAQEIAARGQPVLRFDYSGCGDSSGDLNDVPDAERWIGDIRNAVHFMREHTGAAEIALAGLRIGADFAARALGPDLAAARLALIAAPISNRAYLREIRMLARLIESNPELNDSNSLQVGGYEYPPDLVTSLLAPATPAPACPGLKALLLAGDAPVNHPLGARLRAAGARVETREFAGYNEWMCDPTASRMPDLAISDLADWLVEGAAAFALPAGLQPLASPTLQADGWRETAICFGAENSRAGVYCAPAGGGAAKALIIANAGAIHHVGWARGSVDLARSLARNGIASLRIDLAGIGDSPEPPFATTHLYSPERTADISAAIDWLEREGLQEFSVLGACSGAFQAYEAARADKRISTVHLVNQLCFVWGPAYAMQLAAWRATKSAVAGALLAGDAEEAGRSAQMLGALMPYARTLARSSFSALTTLMARAQSGFGASNPVIAAFEAMSARGMKVNLIYSEGDPGLVELERWLGPDGERIANLPGLERRSLKGADHMLTQRRAREAVEAIVLEAFRASTAALAGAAQSAA